MLIGVKTSFSRPRNIGFLKSKFWRPSDASQTFNLLHPNTGEQQFFV